MTKTKQPLPKFRFMTTFALPALLISRNYCRLLLFRHAQGRFDAQMRESNLINQIRADGQLTEEHRSRAIPAGRFDFVSLCDPSTASATIVPMPRFLFNSELQDLMKSVSAPRHYRCRRRS